MTNTALVAEFPPVGANGAIPFPRWVGTVAEYERVERNEARVAAARRVAEKGWPAFEAVDADTEIWALLPTDGIST